MIEIMKSGDKCSDNPMLYSEVAEAIDYHSNLYFNGNAEISDTEFDNLVAWLTKYNPSNPILIMVGSQVKGDKIKHPSIMGSLKKVHNSIPDLMNEFVDKLPSKEVVVAPKIDGLACRIVYENGNLVLAASRGDGYEGQDLTEKVKAINDIPNQIDSSLNIEVRGEIYMKKSVFEEHRNANNSYVNPRNMAAGTMNLDDIKVIAKRNLSFFAYDVIGKKFENEIERKEWAKKNIPQFNFVSIELVNDYEKVVSEWVEKRKTIDYQIDGLVFSANSIDVQEDMGYSSDGRRPLGKYAFKFAPEQVGNVKILNIDSQVGRTGVITPMARIEPTYVDGSTISNITLHNYDNIKKLGISIGAKVTIEKSGDIIPQIVKVNEEGNGNFNYPVNCPVCETKTVKEGKFVYCTNINCPAKMEETINFFVKTMGMKNIGRGIIKILLDNKIISDIVSLYEIDYKKMEGIEGIGSKTIKEIQKNIEASKNVSLATFLDSLGISSLGTSKSKVFAKKFGSINNVVNVGKNELLEMEGIQEKTANAIIEGIQLMKDKINGLLKYITIEEIKEKNGVLKGKSFCLTGSFSRKKSEINTIIEENGGEIFDSVKKGLTYLVQADKESTSNKTQKAEKLGVEVINEEDLFLMMNGGN